MALINKATIVRLIKTNALRKGLLGGHPLWRAIWVFQLLRKGWSKISKKGEAPITFSESIDEGTAWTLVHVPEDSTKGRGEGRKLLVGPKRARPRATALAGPALSTIGAKILEAPSAERINAILGEEVVQDAEPSRRAKRAAKKLSKQEAKTAAKLDKAQIKIVKADDKALAKATKQQAKVDAVVAKADAKDAAKIAKQQAKVDALAAKADAKAATQKAKADAQASKLEARAAATSAKAEAKAAKSSAAAEAKAAKAEAKAAKSRAAKAEAKAAKKAEAKAAKSRAVKAEAKAAKKADRRAKRKGGASEVDETVESAADAT